ncbi:phosphonate ABC transporter, ATP-binding protein [compost metagenome]
MDPVLAGHTLDVLTREAESRGVTLLASLHAVELALAHFPRIVGVRDGRVVFDLPTHKVGRDDLDALYANDQLGMDDASIAPTSPVVVQIPRC